MGLWDSVNSVGVFYDRIFPYVSHTNIVRHIRHAISIDERRSKFKQYPFFPTIDPIGGRKPKIAVESVQLSSSNTDDVESNESSLKSHQGNIGKGFSRRNKSEVSFVPSWSSSLNPPTPDDNIWLDILDCPGLNEPTGRHVSGYFVNQPLAICEDVCELWFSGDHSDIGGGWVSNDEGQNVSNVALRWMISEACKHGCQFTDGSLTDLDAKYPLKKSLNSPLHDKLCLRLQTNRNQDFMRGKSSLIQSMLWWTLEFLPIFTFKLWESTDKWVRTWHPNLGCRRTIPYDGKFHWSVSWRIAELGYSPCNITANHIVEEWDPRTSEDEYDELRKILEENPRL